MAEHGAMPYTGAQENVPVTDRIATAARISRPELYEHMMQMLGGEEVVLAGYISRLVEAAPDMTIEDLMHEAQSDGWLSELKRMHLVTLVDVLRPTASRPDARSTTAVKAPAEPSPTSTQTQDVRELILDHLRENSWQSVNEISEATGIDPARLRQHLSQLKSQNRVWTSAPKKPIRYALPGEPRDWE